MSRGGCLGFCALNTSRFEGRVIMDWTLEEIRNELRRIPGFVRCTVAIAGLPGNEKIEIVVYRQLPWARLSAVGCEMQQIVNELVELGQVPRL